METADGIQCRIRSAGLRQTARTHSRAAAAATATMLLLWSAVPGLALRHCCCATPSRIPRLAASAAPPRRLSSSEAPAQAGRRVRRRGGRNAAAAAERQQAAGRTEPAAAEAITEERWTPERQGVVSMAPYVPTPSLGVSAALRLLAMQSDHVFIDLGCGDGRLVAAAARECHTAIGIELDSVQAEAARLTLADAELTNASIIQGDVATL